MNNNTGQNSQQNNRDNNSLDIRLLLFAVILTTVAVILFGMLLGEFRSPVNKVMEKLHEGFSSNTDEYFDGGDEETEEIEETIDSEDASQTSEADTTDSQTSDGTDASETSEIPVTSTAEETTEKTATTVKEETTMPETTKKSETKPAETTSKETDPPETWAITERAKDPDYYSDALFIGDSRTVGLYMYGKISGASYFARTSTSVYNLFADKKSETGTGSLNLEEYLKSEKFGKIYILLGINEIGYSASSVVKKYKQNIDRIIELQPDAIILIQANMHVTKAKSDANPKTFNNTRIDTLNSKLAALADNEKIFFLNIVPAFDAEDGDLKTEYSRDGIHLKASAYKYWKNWLLENGKR